MQAVLSSVIRIQFTKPVVPHELSINATTPEH